jgi:uncharacterized protein
MPILTGSDWFAHVIGIAMKVNLPEWWIGAGVLRDIVWGERFAAGFDPALTHDIDLCFFDPIHLDADRDQRAEEDLRWHDPSLPWDAKNQAAVHRWYPKRFGIEVEPFALAEEAMATFPEFATCVAVRRGPDGTWDVVAPYGLDDLLDGVWRRNPRRVTQPEYQTRLERKRPWGRWPTVLVVR